MTRCVLPLAPTVTNHVEAFKRLAEIVEEYFIFPEPLKVQVEMDWSGSDEELEEWHDLGQPDDPRASYAYSFRFELCSMDTETLVKRGRERGMRLIQTIMPHFTMLFIDDPDEARDLHQKLGDHDELTPLVPDEIMERARVSSRPRAA